MSLLSSLDQSLIGCNELKSGREARVKSPYLTTVLLQLLLSKEDDRIKGGEMRNVTIRGEGLRP